MCFQALLITRSHILILIGLQGKYYHNTGYHVGYFFYYVTMLILEKDKRKTHLRMADTQKDALQLKQEWHMSTTDVNFNYHYYYIMLNNIKHYHQFYSQTFLCIKHELNRKCAFRLAGKETGSPCHLL